MADIKTFNNFTPGEYLNEYYSSIGPENDELLRFFANAYSGITPGFKLIEVGGGPTIYQIISAAKGAESITFTDLLDGNLSAITTWLNSGQTAFDWSEYIKKAIDCEGSNDAPENRAQLIRSKVISVRAADIMDSSVNNTDLGGYDVVSSNFVAESINDNLQDWRVAIDNLISLIKPGGWLIMTGLLGATHWVTNDQKYPATFLEKQDIENVLTEKGMTIEHLGHIDAEHDPADDTYQGYQGIFMVKARKEAL